MSLKTVVLLSGQGTSLQSLIDTVHQEGTVDIQAVISNNPDAYGLQRAKTASIPTHVVNHQNHSSRETFDQVMLEVIEPYQPQLVILAGFLRILTPGFVTHFLGRMINMHPSLLPRYPGLLTYDRVLAAKETEHGSTIHFVTELLDDGPIIMQAHVPVLANDTPASLQARVKEQEHDMLPLVVRWFAQGRLSFKNYQALLDAKPLGAQGLKLSEVLSY